ncbi:MAG TPA: ParB/RepB/Spo0J family partition protein [Paraburkholderia sp.]|jgi:ParB-like chromosome segregation protein Spo0J|nr:ParB/RepB/Spo0J family partition protein [Paraburkholderia sp.]
MSSDKLELHPLCTLFPRLEGADFEALKADIEANGQLQPIVVQGGMILDGGNRYRACIELGIEPLIDETDFGDYDLLSYVLSVNLKRRHLTPGQQAAIVASAQDWVKAQAVGKPKSDHVIPLATVADRAAQSGASIPTQKRADRVAKADPELAKRVAHGEISLPNAVKQIRSTHVETERRDAEAGTESANSHAASDEQSSPLDDDPYAEIEALQKRVSVLSSEIDSLAANDTGAEIHRLTQLLLNAEGKVSALEEKQKALKWFGSKFAELRKILDVKFDRDVVTAVKLLKAMKT